MMTGSHPTEGGGPVPLKVKVVRFEPAPIPGAFYGFVTCGTNAGLVFHRLHVFKQAGDVWTKFPNRPKLNNLKATKRKTGGLVSEPVVTWHDQEAKANFDRLVAAALDDFLRKEAS